MRTIVTKMTKFFHQLEIMGWPLLLVVIRLKMAHIFWKSGRIKFTHWDSTISLFRFEYKVPYLPPDLAAYCATMFELVCPILLTIGLMTRLAVVPLLIMTAVIQLTYLNHSDHLYWAILLGTLLLKGAGPLSLDGYLYKRD